MICGLSVSLLTQLLLLLRVGDDSLFIFAEVIELLLDLLKEILPEVHNLVRTPTAERLALFIDVVQSVLPERVRRQECCGLDLPLPLIS